MDKNRRHVIKSIGAATASSLAAPYLNLAHAQGSPIPLGVALPLTGNAGAYGPDMAEAAKRTAAKINAAGGVLGRKLELFIEDSESSAAVAANLSHKLAATAALDSESSMKSSSLRPSTPPAALIFAAVRFAASAMSGP